MPRKLRDARLDTRTARLELAARREPYWRVMQTGRALGYRRIAGRAGTWIARHNTAGERQYHALGDADDVLDADGGATLTFAQAQEAAAGWFAEVERAAGRVVAPLTVEEAMERYVDDYLARGGKSGRDLRTTIAAHILPTLGKRQVRELTFAAIKAWHQKLASAPARLRTSAKATKANTRTATDPAAQRARRASANRILTVLKAALNHAWRERLVPMDEAWRPVRPFANADAAKVRYLTDVEQQRLVNACLPDLRPLVTAALLTGCRYSELARAQAADFDAAAGVLHIREAKAGKPRTVPLTAEAQRLFSGLAAGKPGTALLLTRADGGAWGESHQFRPLRDACSVARIEPAVSFHILRHTFASRLAQRAVPMAVIAAALGNTEAICARHYAHLAPGYVADTIRQAAGDLGIVPVETVVRPLRRVTPQ